MQFAVYAARPASCSSMISHARILGARTGCPPEARLMASQASYFFVNVASTCEQMHDFGIWVDHHVIGDSDRADLGNSTEVIGGQDRPACYARKALPHRQAARSRAPHPPPAFCRADEPATRRWVRRPLSSRTSVSGEEHMISSPSMERNTMYGEGLVVRSTRYALSRLS